ncbi:uncharacterized protein LOC106166668 [Lingula anatina]|uniref:Uncharacterized protein LOC106166668 n=1 Tax=Lingula anatina TaxID=7574 RepID=A0A1S3ITB2_LINAN|nr:uncharacterized protein LOC106166668 [Lingula anatina]|eukprot:XP_013400769.1 uncharacterized protein LOC106166668 [Lingula anatina]
MLISRLLLVRSYLVKSGKVGLSSIVNNYSRASMATVTFQTENKLGDCPGHMVDVPGCKKGLIVLQEWWGMNDQIKQQATNLSKDGHLTTLVPDLYRGKVATDRETAGHYMGDLDWPGAVKDVQAAARFLQSKGCVKVGVTGFCMGGALAFAAAALVPEISAAAPFYGIPGQQLADLTTIKIPVEAHFGKKDTLQGFSSPDDYRPLVEKLKAAGVDIVLLEYDAGHGFTNFQNPLGTYDEEAAKQALGRMLEFMNEKLE